MERDPELEHDDGQHLMEFAGRACYQSFGKTNPKTATNEGYLRNILVQKHESVLEHMSVSFYIEGVSRSLTHELVRHRHFSYSQLSQRYVDSADVAFVIPPAYEGDQEAIIDLGLLAGTAIGAYNRRVQRGMAQGKTRKQAREAARAVLPNETETKLVVTGNLRAWKEFLVKRDNPAADREIQRLAREIRDQLELAACNVFSEPAREAWDDSAKQEAPQPQKMSNGEVLAG
ncbi:thymidylate synthase (FAD) [Rhodococcus sp. ACS1]|nr:thymidylate synthase (FAD) [Rhodococcus sp. ACS1]